MTVGDNLAAAQGAVDALRRGLARGADDPGRSLADAHDLLAVVVRTTAGRGWLVSLHPTVDPAAGAYVKWVWNLDGPQGQMTGGTATSFSEAVVALHDATSMRS